MADALKEVWRQMKYRCFSEKCKEYKYYGGRGITVCEEWLDFKNFERDMREGYISHKELNGKRNTSIDRVDVNGNYEPSNCRWATNSEQMKNRRKRKVGKIKTKVKCIGLSPEGKTYYFSNQAEFAREHDLCQANINYCLRGTRKTHKGWKFKYSINEEEDKTIELGLNNDHCELIAEKRKDKFYLALDNGCGVDEIEISENLYRAIKIEFKEEN